MNGTTCANQFKNYQIKCCFKAKICTCISIYQFKNYRYLIFLEIKHVLIYQFKIPVSQLSILIKKILQRYSPIEFRFSFPAYILIIQKLFLFLIFAIWQKLPTIFVESKIYTNNLQWTSHNMYITGRPSSPCKPALPRPWGLTCAGDFDWQFVVIIAYKWHVPKHCPVVANVPSVSQIILGTTDHGCAQQLGLGISLGF